MPVFGSVVCHCDEMIVGCDDSGQLTDDNDDMRTLDTHDTWHLRVTLTLSWPYWNQTLICLLSSSWCSLLLFRGYKPKLPTIWWMVTEQKVWIDLKRQLLCLNLQYIQIRVLRDVYIIFVWFVDIFVYDWLTKITWLVGFFFVSMDGCRILEWDRPGGLWERNKSSL